MNVLIIHHHLAERQLIEGILRGLGARVEALAEGARVGELVKKRKFDGVFLDGEAPGINGLELVRQIRKSPSNKKAPIVYITGEKSTIPLSDAFAAGVTFFLTRPLDKTKVTRLLNATRGSMLAERRSYHRVPAQVPVRFKAGSRSGQGQSVNISRSGLLFEAGGMLKLGDKVEVEFVLPNQTAALHAQGEVARVDTEQRAGVRLTRLAAADLEQLQNFIGI